MSEQTGNGTQAPAELPPGAAPAQPPHVQREAAALSIIRQAREARESVTQPERSDPPPPPAGNSTPDTPPLVDDPRAADAAPTPAPVTEPTAEEASVEAPSTEAPQTEEVEAQTLGDLATILDLEDASPLYKLQVKYDTPDGPVSDTIEGWKDKARDLAIAQALRKQHEEALEQAQKARAEESQRFEQQTQQAAAMLEAAKQSALGQFQGINWQQLAQDDPGEYAMKRQMYNDTVQAIEHQQRELAGQWQAHQQQQEAAAAEERKAYLGREQAALLKAIPEWGDAETAKTGGLEIADYLQRQGGFTPDEVNTIADHRLVLIARKAMLYDKEVKAAEPKRKLVLGAVKAGVKPAARRTAAQHAADHIKSLKATAQRTGRMADVMAWRKAVRESQT